MPALTLCAFAFEQIVQYRYGTAGVIGLGIYTAGHKTKNTTFTCVGLVVIALLLAQ